MTKMLVADLLCGAGGSSTGCARALRRLGLKMELVCVNHWPVAIETHTRNHPQARHYCQDIATVRPHLIVPEGYLDLLMASPSCTHHSVARGGKPTSDQQRSDPWHVITWLTELRVKRMIIENVWEFTNWGPVDPETRRPIRERKGEYFRAWVGIIRTLGFEPEWFKLNAADYGGATTRQRFILMARNDRQTLLWPVRTHRKNAETGKRWRPARDIIDWDIKGRSIYTRKKPLSIKTLRRIEAGIVKFSWPEPFLVVLRNHMDGKSLDGPLPTIAAGGQHLAFAQPIILATGQSPARGVVQPLPTITTGGAGTAGHPGCARPMLVEPILFNGRKGNKARAVSDDPVPTLDTKGGVWLAEPFIATVAHGNSARERNPDDRRCRALDDPLQTIQAGGGKFAVIEPFVLSQASGGAPRAAADPLPTAATGGAIALISPYYGSGSGETCNTVESPLPTATAKARFGLVIPITHSDGSNRARDVELDPLPTLTTAHRGELAFIAAQLGERDGQAPRVHDVDGPAPGILATGHVNLIEGAPQYDILFRMLEPHELAAAMGFNSEETAYEFAGNKTERVKQIGNAVSVEMMDACVSSIMADSAPSIREAAE